MKRALLLHILISCSLFSFSQNKLLRLWYTKPAGNWLEAVPLGNGHMGAMVFGAVSDERIILNECTLYAEEPGSGNMPEISMDFEAVTSMIRSGTRHAEVDDYITKHWTGRSTPCYQPLGDIKIHFNGTGAISGYERELDLTNAVTKVHYRQEGIYFEREVFTSYPDNVMVIRLKSDKKAIGFTL